MGARAEGRADVFRQRTDISALAAADAQLEDWRRALQELELVDPDLPVGTLHRPVWRESSPASRP